MPVFSKFKKQLYDKLLIGNNLVILCEKLHVCIVAILLTQNIPITFYRYTFTQFPLYLTWVNIAEISTYTFSLILFYKGKRELSIFVTAFGIPVIFIYLLFFSGLDVALVFSKSFWFLLCFKLIYIIILRRKITRYLYIIFCLLLYFIPGAIITYTYPEDFIKIIQILTLIFIPYIISTFVEIQDTQISNLHSNLKLRLQEKLVLTVKLKNKNEELITFSHIMSHDLKSPLHAIISFSNLIKRGNNFSSAEQEKYFTYIEKSAISMSMLIDDLLVYSKIEAQQSELKLVKLNTIIEEVSFNFQFDLIENNLMLNVSDLPLIKGDKLMLKTLFHNLISNSIKYQPKEKLSHRPTISISHQENNNNHFVFLEDNGIGIKETYISNLFVPFKRFHSDKEYEGTGLGLSICRQVMDKHGGSIELKSTSENGSLFKIIFPKK